jgi:hypothetical protein
MPHLMAPSAAAEGEPERRGRRRGATEQAAVGTGGGRCFMITTTLDGISFTVRAWRHPNRCLGSVRLRFGLIATPRTRRVRECMGHTKAQCIQLALAASMVGRTIPGPPCLRRGAWNLRSSRANLNRPFCHRLHPVFRPIPPRVTQANTLSSPSSSSPELEPSRAPPRPPSASSPPRLVPSTNAMGSSEADEDQLLKSFLAEVSETERDNEVLRSFPPSLPSSSPPTAGSFRGESPLRVMYLQIPLISRS